MKLFTKLLPLLLVPTLVLAGLPMNEKEAGTVFFNMVKQRMPLVADPITNDYITHLGFDLVSYSDDPTHSFHFFIVRASDINAFAGPGGYIGINAGLITATQSESELAAVMAHEIAHVTQKHLYRAMEKSQNLTLPSIAAAVAAIATGGASAAGGISAVGAGNIQYQLGLTRGYEKEADAVGIETLSNAGFNPQALIDFFETMQENQQFDMGTPSFLRSHPVTMDRIAEAQNRIDSLHSTPQTSSQEYALTRARMDMVLAPSTKDFLTMALKQYHLHPGQPAAIYRYALALWHVDQTGRAIALLTKLSKQFPNQFIYPYTAAEIYNQQQDIETAKNILQYLYQKTSDYPPAVLFYARVLSKAGEYTTAESILTDHQADLGDNPAYWGVLSQVQAANGDLVFSHISQAKGQLLLGNKQLAKAQCQIALQQPGNSNYSRAMIQAMLSKL